ncbi:MAG: hypothetical protein J5827_00360, partial [Oscillospiraceae bacterium]|nr:hypothetical protein [Oscillospiraceae bacterium]
MSSSGTSIPEGYIYKEEYFQKGGFQDYTDFCKYWYKDSKPVEEDLRFRQISQFDTETISGYFNDFRSWMEVQQRLDEYEFDVSRIDAGDYVLIRTKEGEQIGNSGHLYGKYDCYSVFFFDTD